MQSGRTSRHRRCAAFSLIEMIIIVLIIGVVAGLAVPMMSDTAATRLSSAAKLLATDLAFAQNESITHGDDLRLIVFDTTTNTYHIAPASAPDTPVSHPVDRQPYSVTFGEGRAPQLTGVTIQSVSMDGDAGSTDDRFQYGLYGQIDQASAATITLEADGMTLTISVHPSTGEVTIGSMS